MQKIINNLLEKVQNITKINVTYWIKNGGVLAIGQFITTLLGLVLTLVFANIISKNDYGTYRFLISGLSIIGIFSLSGLQTSTTKSIALGFEKTLISNYKKYLLWSIIPSAMSLLVGCYYLLEKQSILAFGFFAIAIVFPTLKSSELFDSFLLGKKLFTRRAKFNVLQSLVVTTITTLILILTKNILLVFITFLIVNTFILFIFYTKVKKQVNLNTETDSSSLSYGKHLSVINGLNFISQEIDKILLFQFLGPAKLAAYTLATAGPLKIDGFKLSLRNAILPHFSNQKFEDLQKTLPRKAVLLSLVFAIIVLIYIFFAPALFSLVLPKYLESITYSQVFALGLIFSPFILIFNQALTSHAKTKVLYKTKVLSSFFRITVVAILIPLYGIWGGIFSYLASQLFNSAVLYFHFKKPEKVLQTI